jgi:hypothetical protein
VRLNVIGHIIMCGDGQESQGEKQTRATQKKPTWMPHCSTGCRSTNKLYGASKVRRPLAQGRKNAIRAERKSNQDREAIADESKVLERSGQAEHKDN